MVLLTLTCELLAFHQRRLILCDIPKQTIHSFMPQTPLDMKH